MHTVGADNAHSHCSKQSDVQSGIFEGVGHRQDSRAQIPVQHVNQSVQIGRGVLQLPVLKWIVARYLLPLIRRRSVMSHVVSDRNLQKRWLQSMIAVEVAANAAAVVIVVIIVACSQQRGRFEVTLIWRHSRFLPLNLPLVQHFHPVQSFVNASGLILYPSTMVRMHLPAKITRHS